MQPCLFYLFLIFFSTSAFAQKSAMFHIDSLPTEGTSLWNIPKQSGDSREGILLDKGWKYQTGDNPDFAKPHFDDSAWTPIDPTKDIMDLPHIFDAQIKWLRLDFEVKNKLPNPLGIAINQVGASEIYLNGHLMHQFGHFDTDSTKVKGYDPLEYPILFPADSVGQYHLAVRYALQPNIRYTNMYSLTKNRLFHARVLNLIPTLNNQREFRVYYTGLGIFKLGVFFILFALHIAFYIHQRSNKTHLVLAVCFLMYALYTAFKILAQNQFLVENRYFNSIVSNYFFSIGLICIYNAYYRMAKVRLDIYYYAFAVCILVCMFIPSFTYTFSWYSASVFIVSVFTLFLIIRLMRIGLKKGIKGFFVLIVSNALIIISNAFMILSIVVLKYSVSPYGVKVLNSSVSPYLLNAVFNLAEIVIPVGLSVFMGIEGNETNKALSKQLVENDQLKGEAIEQEQEKQHILATQKDTLEKEVTLQTQQIRGQAEELRVSLTEKEFLLKEVHHRVKNNLEVISSLLTLQTSNIVDAQAKAALAESQSRVQSIALIHHKLYRNDELSTVELNGFASDLFKQVSDLFKKQGENVEFNIVGNDKHIDTNTAVPLGLILNELFTNAFKYAVKPNKDNKLSLFLEKIAVNTEGGISQELGGQKGQHDFKMTFRDNGLGLPDGFKIEKTSSLGMKVIKLLTKQIGGSLKFYNDNGAVFDIRFSSAGLKVT